MDISINSSWKKLLKDEFTKPYFNSLVEFIKKEYQTYTCYPKFNDIFNAFNLTTFEKVKVVILGQDPYHGIGQAHGLCFSVPNEVVLPPSLKNIFIELKKDIGVIKQSGDLSKWAEQGILLLNSILTVRAHEASSHQGKGWEIFTDEVIKTISNKKENIIFILWGTYAQQKTQLINESKHKILKSVHPSPLSAYRGFFGSNPFSEVNKYLQFHHKTPINW